MPEYSDFGEEYLIPNAQPKPDAPLVDLARVEEIRRRTEEDSARQSAESHPECAHCRAAFHDRWDLLATVTRLAEAVERTEKALDAEQDECATWRMRAEAAQEENARLLAALERLRNAINADADAREYDYDREVDAAIAEADAALAPRPAPPGEPENTNVSFEEPEPPGEAR